MPRIVFVVLLLFAHVTAVAAGETWSDPHPGVSRMFKTTSEPLRIHALVVDLCHPGIGVRATAPSEKQRTTSSFGGLVGAEAAINGDFFSYNNYFPIGYAMGDGVHWPGTGDSNWQAVVAFGPYFAQFYDEAAIFSGQWGVTEAMSGFAQIIKDGTPINSYSCAGHFCQKHPRTAVGLSRDRRTLFLLVVDGRTSLTVGVTLAELAGIMYDLGAYDAVNLDGGGSTTMWVDGLGVVSDPSDGSQRVVANHLAVHADGAGQPGSCVAWPEEQVFLDAGLFDAAGSTDVDGDGLADVCARAAAGLLCALSAGGLGTIVQGPHPELSDDQGWDDSEHYGTIHMGDVDGDGLADVCARGNSGMRCWRSVADGFDPTDLTGPAWSDAEGWWDVRYHATIRMLDLDGDGLADLCGRSPDGIVCHLSTGDGFGPPIVGPEASDESGWGHPDHYGTIRTGDVDGDGRHDLCARGGAGYYCWLSIGEGFGAKWTIDAWSDAAGFNEMRYWATIRLVDVNGDGMADACARGPDGIECYPSTGDGFGPMFSGPYLADADGWGDPTNYLPLRWGDMDGDGMADVCARANAGILCWPSTGAGFGAQVIGPPLSDDANWFRPRYHATLRMADVDGDGRDDICGRDVDRVRCWLSDGAGFPTEWEGPAWGDAVGWGGMKYWATFRVDAPWTADPCLFPDACAPGAVETQPCGDCGTQERECGDGCVWAPWGSCVGSGQVSPGCDDGDPCTDDLCGVDGVCAPNPVPGCCHKWQDCDAPLEACDEEALACVSVLCLPCDSDGDCGAPGNRCLVMDGGHYCGIDCREDPEICPAEALCFDYGGITAQCVPDGWDCAAPTPPEEAVADAPRTQADAVGEVVQGPNGDPGEEADVGVGQGTGSGCAATPAGGGAGALLLLLLVFLLFCGRGFSPDIGPGKGLPQNRIGPGDVRASRGSLCRCALRRQRSSRSQDGLLRG